MDILSISLSILINLDLISPSTSSLISSDIDYAERCLVAFVKGLKLFTLIAFFSQKSSVYYSQYVLSLSTISNIGLYIIYIDTQLCDFY